MDRVTARTKLKRVVIGTTHLNPSEVTNQKKKGAPIVEIVKKKWSIFNPGKIFRLIKTKIQSNPYILTIVSKESYG